MNDLPDQFDRLAARLATLEQRVFALEHPAEAPRPVPQFTAPAQRAGHPLEASSLPDAGGLFLLLGKAMLGIAGAYLLRALSESGSLPRLGVALVAIVYAMLWLVLAVRVPAANWIASVIYAGTSALILAPMLWELTLNFKVFPAAATSVILSLFVSVAYALAWKRNLQPVLWVATVCAVIVSLALAIATRELVPFTFALLFTLLVGELAEALNRPTGFRMIVALAADVAVWTLSFIYAGPPAERPTYPPLNVAALLVPALILFSVAASSTVVKTVILRKTIRVFEIVQTVIAFGLAATALLTFAPSLGSSLLGVICLALSAAAYLLVFRFFAYQSARRNYIVFAAWSAALFLLGCILAVPSPLSAQLLALVALAATWIGIRANRVAIQFQATAYLIAAAIVSGMPAYVFHALAGVMPSAPSWPVVVVSICAAACYLVRKPLPRESWQSQLMQLVAATFSVSVVAAFLVNLLARLAAFAIQPQAHHLALIRTFVLCATVLSLAFAGVRGRRPELSRIAYFALALVAVKLVLEDLSHGQLAFIAASIFLFAVTLMVVPRLARAGKRLHSQLD